MHRLVLITGLVLVCSSTMGHGFGGSGLLHPLTGVDHLIAMIAVGAWSAQLGGKAILRVPTAFLIFMCAGGLAGLNHFSQNFTEYGIAVSIILLGMAIAVNKRLAWFFAAAAVGIFGFFHGFAHGTEIPKQTHVVFYIVGFLITTLALHVLGAIGGLLLMDEKQGRFILRALGVIAAFVGIILFISYFKVNPKIVTRNCPDMFIEYGN